MGSTIPLSGDFSKKYAEREPLSVVNHEVICMKDGTAHAFATVSWFVEDVLEHRPNWSVEKAKDFLREYEKHIWGHMIDEGRIAIEVFLQDFEEVKK